ncbi:MAG: hypothetical protein CMF50_03525 [Legionellales bacterium]|nr:hypothetical protein [Legionellales bacterium]|tara:strand:+ start:379 stop:828 length:450 start_codon:yes stop_codon:yes gene_type:complete
MVRVITLVLLGFPLVSFAVPHGDIQMGRYLTTKSTFKKEQINLLQQTISVHLPSSVNTVGDAVVYLSTLSGYSLVTENKQSVALQNLLAKPLPVVDRDLKGLTVEQGLLTLVAPAFQLDVDPVNRWIDFELKPQYKEMQQRGEGQHENA